MIDLTRNENIMIATALEQYARKCDEESRTCAFPASVGNAVLASREAMNLRQKFILKDPPLPERSPSGILYDRDYEGADSVG